MSRSNVVSFRRWSLLATAFLTLCLLAGCVRVKPWEREVLADPTMSFEEESGADQLIFEAREGSAGGFGSGGGGCACKR